MQTDLFADAENPDYFEDRDLGDASIREYPSAFTPDQASSYLETLIQTVAWQQDSLWIAGREIAVPRLQCWMGDSGCNYGYSGIRLEPEPWDATVQAIREQVQTLTGITFNSVLLNFYRNGQDSVAWHADDEPELGPNPVIASVSFGAERLFQLKHKQQPDRAPYKILLRNGSLLLMGKTLQNNWLHQLPKSRKLADPRINLTFRTIL